MTTVTLLPNEDLENSGSTAGLEPDTPPYGWQHLTDGNPSSYIVLYEWRLGFDTFTIPPAGIVTSAALTARGWNQGDNTPPASPGGDIWFAVILLAQLRNAAGTQLAGWSLNFPGGGPPVRTVRTSPKALLTADQTTVDGLQIYMQRPDNVGAFIGMDQLSLAVTYVARPVVTVTAPPAGTILTANPVCTWTFTGDVDADNAGTQTRYHIKAFTNAVFGAAGFNPDTSPTVYDSGVVVSDIHSVTIGPFDNLTEFKAYVRAAQNVNSASQWSLWAAGSAFTTNTDPPVIATLTATVDDPHGAIVITARRDTAHTNWTHINVERSIDGGVTWTTVRGAVALAATADTMVVYDYEQPEGIPTSYRARGLVMSGTLILSSGNWTTTAAPVTWTVAMCGEWLRSSEDLAHGAVVELVVDEAVTTTAHSIGLLDVIGRASPVTVWDTPSLPTGEMTVVTRTIGDADTLSSLLRTAPVLLYQGRYDWGHRYRWMAVTGHVTSRQPSADRMFRDFRQWTITYVEVDAPPVLS